jgi:hypothetical protein
MEAKPVLQAVCGRRVFIFKVKDYVKVESAGEMRALFTPKSLACLWVLESLR